MAQGDSRRRGCPLRAVTTVGCRSGHWWSTRPAGANASTPGARLPQEPGTGGDSGPRRRVLGQHVAQPEERARGSRKGSLSSSSGASTDEASCHLARKLLQRRGSEGALRAGDHVLMTPALLGHRPSLPRAGEWHGAGVNSLSAEPERPRPKAASTVPCTRSMTLDRALSYCFRVFISPNNFFLLWKRLSLKILKN